MVPNCVHFTRSSTNQNLFFTPPFTFSTVLMHTYFDKTLPSYKSLYLKGWPFFCIASSKNRHVFASFFSYSAILASSSFNFGFSTSSCCLFEAIMALYFHLAPASCLISFHLHSLIVCKQLLVSGIGRLQRITSVNKNPGSAKNPDSASLKIWKLCVSSRHSILPGMRPMYWFDCRQFLQTASQVIL